MTKLNSDRVNKVKENFTFTFKRFVEYRNQQIIDAIIHQKKKSKDGIKYDLSLLQTPLSLDELEIAWSFYDDNFEWLEELVYNAIAQNYIDAHSDEPKKVAHEFDKVGD
jgi:hypothetical protein|tara:strand:+ start:152 stop:478 length:327 start_codon:yes stop_codon:yes gene_type:complete